MQGLSSGEAAMLQQLQGKNIYKAESSRRFIQILWDIIKEPLFILLQIACSLYLILGETGEGFMMLAAVIFAGAISLYQEAGSTNTVKAWQQFALPAVRVIRNGSEPIISSAELVPGDRLVLA